MTKGTDKGIFCLDVDATARQGAICWIYFNFSKDDWPSKLKVSDATVQYIKSQETHETMCGILMNNTIPYIVKNTL